jgi:hypothetical protein
MNPGVVGFPGGLGLAGKRSLIGIQRFTASGTYKPSPGTKYVLAYLQASAASLVCGHLVIVLLPIAEAMKNPTVVIGSPTTFGTASSATAPANGRGFQLNGQAGFFDLSSQRQSPCFFGHGQAGSVFDGSNIAGTVIIEEYSA